MSSQKSGQSPKPEGKGKPLSRRTYITTAGLVIGSLGTVGYVGATRDPFDEIHIDEGIRVERVIPFHECSLLVEGYVMGTGEIVTVQTRGHNSNGKIVTGVTTDIDTFEESWHTFQSALPATNCGIKNIRGYSVYVIEPDRSQ